MPGLSEIITNLSKARMHASRNSSFAPASRLRALSAFGSNPGQLRAWTYVPAERTHRPALVVVLHGCTQTASGYDIGSGWSQLADRHGFILLFPEQQRQNNPNLCFNWFLPEDYRRESGEALSIRQMIDAVADCHKIDPARIFVTGLSAGGAMASVMLATYPEVFSGGAIVAGLPYGCADTIPEALSLMRGRDGPGEIALTGLVRKASDHDGSWPTISVWHGTSDSTVNPDNADAIVSQWRALHGVGRDPDRTEVVDGYPRRVWRNEDGRDVIEEFRIAGMGHGTPLDTLSDGGCGQSGAYMLEAGISSTERICDFWNLSNEEGFSAESIVTNFDAAANGTDTHLRQQPQSPSTSQPPAIAKPVGAAKVIEDALRAAGLMR